MKRKQIKNGIPFLAFLILAAGLYIWKNAPDVKPDPTEAGQEPYKVTRVVDGDTIAVNIAGKEEKVRLIGVDTPESVHPDKSKNIPYGKVAANYTKEKLLGQMVNLEYDVQQRDKYGRLLAYVYLDGELFNQIVVEEGHAKVATFPPNVKYVETLTEAQTCAREEKKGLWKED